MNDASKRRILSFLVLFISLSGLGFRSFGFFHVLDEDLLDLVAIPPQIGLWDITTEAATCKFEASMDLKPCSALVLNQSKTLMIAGFVPGHKNM